MKYMNKITLGVLVLMLLCASPAGADWMSLTTGAGQAAVSSLTADATASGIAVSGAAAFHGIVVKTDGVNNVTLNVYDGVGVTATTLTPADTVILGSERIWAISYAPAIKCTAGIYVSISVAGGGAATWKVQYDN